MPDGSAFRRNGSGAPLACRATNGVRITDRTSIFRTGTGFKVISGFRTHAAFPIMAPSA
jgi:hypothetical protein